MAQTESSISRRDLLRKGAVAGAVAWTAPVVLSSPAFAATGKCSGSKPCVNFYAIKVQQTAYSSGDGGNCAPPTTTNCAGQSIDHYQDGQNQGVTGSHTTLSGSWTLPAGVVPLYWMIKTGAQCFRVDFNADGTIAGITPPPPAANDIQVSSTGSIGSGMTLTVTVGSDTGGYGISHMAVVFCK